MIVMIFVLIKALLFLLFYTDNPYFFTTFSNFLSLLFPYFFVEGHLKACLMFFIAYPFKGQLASACVRRTSENCKSHVLQDKCNIEIFLYPEVILFSWQLLVAGQTFYIFTEFMKEKMLILGITIFKIFSWEGKSLDVHLYIVRYTFEN